VGSSAGRRKAEYVRFRERLQIERPPCCLQSGPWCTGVGDTVEHDPPLSSAPSVAAWEMLRLRGAAHWRGACKPCQDRQGAAIRNGDTLNAWSW